MSKVIEFPNIRPACRVPMATDVNRCCRCGGPMSYNDGIYFCRCLDTAFISDDFLKLKRKERKEYV